MYIWVKKCHFGNFSKRAGIADSFGTDPQKVLIEIEKLFIFWVGMNIYGYWKAELD